MSTRRLPIGQSRRSAIGRRFWAHRRFGVALPALGGATALTLAGIGQALAEHGSSSLLVPGCYLLSIGIYAATGIGRETAAEDSSPPPTASARRGQDRVARSAVGVDVPGGRSQVAPTDPGLGQGRAPGDATDTGGLDGRTQVAPIDSDAVDEGAQSVPASPGKRTLTTLLGRAPQTNVALCGFVLAGALGLVAGVLVYRSLEDPAVSPTTGPLLWLASLVVLVASAAMADRPGVARIGWGASADFLRSRGVWSVATLCALILAVAAVARLVGLDAVPEGINADEGDRAATAISIVRGFDAGSIFSSGWYYISTFYFWLLAGVFRLLGIGYVQARVFGAVSSLVTLAVVMWIGMRHFSVRAGLIAGILGALMGVSLQFARETTEATQTALLWTVSVALLLEARRRGRLWPWALAGISGGLSIYFYPTGRLWAVLAALVCGQFILAARERLRVVAGAALTGWSALLTMGPFIANIATTPEQWGLRAEQTSIFTGDNPTRLEYYNPHWSTAQLIGAQIERAFSVFSSVGDGGGFWPTDRPIMHGLLAVLVLLGVGWASLSIRQSARFALGAWFWVGFLGVIVTVETPNVQRLATAVPALPLLAAAVLDDLARRAEALAASWHRARPAATLLALALAAVLAGQQGIFYFTVYGATDRWPQPTVQGRAVADQGTDTLVVTVGREYHQINAGWVRLLAPNTLRGGLQSPGIGLPLEIPAQHDLAFMLYPTQQMYLPYLQSVYPGGAIHPYTYPTEGLVVSMYRITREQWAATQGARVTSSGFGTTNVDGLGTLPRGVAHLPVSLTWTAGLRVSQYWNYGIRVGPGPARLRIDGVPVLTVPAGAAARTAKVALARGVHSLTLDATVLRRGAPPTITWKSLAPRDISGLAVPQGWQPLPEQDLVSNVVRPEGLTGVVEGAGTPVQRRIDGTLATCCLASDVRPQGGGFRAVWTGSLQAPRSGVYGMSLFTEGPATLQIDGRQVIRSTTPADNQADARVRLAAGSHDVRVQYDVPPGSPGGLEWSWTPPGGRQSIVPPLALSPGSDAVESPAPPSVLGKPTDQPQDEPLDELQ